MSLIWRGKSLEPQLGKIKFAFLLFLMTVTSSVIYCLLAKMATYFTGVRGSKKIFSLLFHVPWNLESPETNKMFSSQDESYLHHCVHGFTGVIFALKAVTQHYEAPDASTSMFGFYVPYKRAIWIELIVLKLLVPNASLLSHLAGILAARIYCSTIAKYLHPTKYE